MKISAKRQISIPKKIMDELQIKPGDEVEFRLENNRAVLIPVASIRVPRDQAWFWSREWQEREKQADQELASGKYCDFENLEDLLKDLNRENQKD